MRLAALILTLAPTLASILALPACAVRQETTAPAAYSQASPYAQGAAAAAPARVIAPAPGSYCEEAVGEAQDAAMQAQATGSPRDAGRANRSAGYAARDCR